MTSRRRIALVATCTTVAVTLMVCSAGSWGARQAEPAEAASEVLVYVKQSKLIETPWPVTRVSVTDPTVADVQVLSPQQVLLQGKAVGSTDLILWGDSGQAEKSRVRVIVDLETLAHHLKSMFPGSRLKLSQAENVVVVAGQLARVEHAAQLQAFLEATELEYLDMTSIAGVQQVMLKVRVAEVSRRALRAMGINGYFTDFTGENIFGGVNIGSSTGAMNPTSIGVPANTAATGNLPFQFLADTTVNPAVTMFAGFPEWDLELFIQALAENQYLRLLAEPNLVALSGETASFLAGGEYPIPVVQSTVANSITVEYKEFGVRLAFSPVVLGDGSIRLTVAPEVSQLSDVGAVEIANFRIPSLLTRKAETTLEMKSGQSFAMAGLISREVTARASKVPGLGDMPVLGALFRSQRYERGETELLVLVTANLVEPLSVDGDLPVPGDLHQEPDAWEFYGMGLIEGTDPVALTPDQQAKIDRLGLSQLKGPGAWQEYNQAPVYSRAEETSEVSQTMHVESSETEMVTKPAASPVDD